MSHYYYANPPGIWTDETKHAIVTLVAMAIPATAKQNCPGTLSSASWLSVELGKFEVLVKLLMILS